MLHFQVDEILLYYIVLILSGLIIFGFLMLLVWLAYRDYVWGNQIVDVLRKRQVIYLHNEYNTLDTISLDTYNRVNYNYEENFTR